MKSVGIKLVIADDAPFIREVVKNFVLQHDIEVVGEASNGSEAVLITKRTRPDVVLMDVVMPEKSGIEATKEIIKDLPQTRVIGCSTVDHESIVLSALDAGCCHFITKPFQGPALVEAIVSSVMGRKGSKP